MSAMADEERNVACKLGVNKYHPDERHCHIKIDKTCPDETLVNAVIRCCPAALYSKSESGSINFDYLGCLECGACRVVGEGGFVHEWRYPAGGMGIEYRMG